MDEKTKISLLYMLIGGLLGIVSAFLRVWGVPNTALLLLYIVVIYATTYVYPVVGVQFERLGQKRYRSALSGIWPSILPWLVVWTMIFYMVSPVVLLAGPPHEQTAEELGEYLESNGIHVNITSNYSRYVFAHKVLVFGYGIPIPLGTSYGVSAFPDAIQRMVGEGKKNGTTDIESMYSGEFITIRKTARLIIILSGQEGSVTQIATENRETIYNLLK
jgi:hypothetical protein